MPYTLWRRQHYTTRDHITMCWLRIKKPTKPDVLPSSEGSSTPRITRIRLCFCVYCLTPPERGPVYCRKKAECFLIHLLSCDAFSSLLLPLKKKKKNPHGADSFSLQISLGPCYFVCFTVEDDELPDLKKDSDLPIIPNYLANPPFPYVYNTMSNSIPDPAMNGSISHSEPQGTDSLSSPHGEACTRAAAQPGSAAAEAAGNGCMPVPALPGECAAPPHTKPALQRGPVHQGAVSWSRSPSSGAGSTQSVLQQENGSCVGPVPAFQPVFFTGAFPLNMQGNSKSLCSLCLRTFVTLDNETRLIRLRVVTALLEIFHA